MRLVPKSKRRMNQRVEKGERGASLENEYALKYFLVWFEIISSPHINLTKSKLYKVEEVGNFELLTRVLGCELDSGLPLAAELLFVFIWKRVFEKVFKRAGWKMKWLSIGRATLLKAIPNYIPNYHLSLFPIPLEV